MYGTQTLAVVRWCLLKFENDVEMYGTQTIPLPAYLPSTFENDVEMYGTQTSLLEEKHLTRLRMM